MEKWYSRFRRGDVWYLHLGTETGDGNTNSSVQKNQDHTSLYHAKRTI